MESADKSLESLLAETDSLIGAGAINNSTQRQRVTEVERELRERGSQLYLQPGKHQQAIEIFAAANKLRSLLTSPKVWDQRFETLDAGRFETPIRDLELSPLEIRNYIAARLFTTLDGVDVVRTNGLYLGLGVANDEDARLGKRKNFTLNGDTCFPGLLESLTRKKQHSLIRRGRDLQHYMVREAVRLDFLSKGYGSLQVVEQQDPKRDIKIGESTHRADPYVSMINNSSISNATSELTLKPDNLRAEIQKNADSIFRTISWIDVGPYTPHEVGSVRDGGRSSRR